MHTLVQHSGFGYGGNPQFQQAVEEREIPKIRLEKVKDSGAVIVENYVEAFKAAELANYPPEVKGIVPRARGSFAKIKVDGLRLYIPSMNDNLGKYHVEKPDP